MARTVESVKRRAKQSSGNYDSWLNPDIPFLKCKEGEITIRIVPKDPEFQEMKEYGDCWEVPVFLHNGIGVNKNTYLCLQKMKGEPCPVCEARVGADKEEQNAFAPKFRGLCFVIDRDDEGAGPQAWPMPVKLFREINGRSETKDGHLISIDGEFDKKTGELKDGYDISFLVEGSGIKRTYDNRVEVSRDASPLNDDIKTENRWLKYTKDNRLCDILVFYEYDYIRKVLMAQIDPGEDATEDDDAPVRGRRGVAATEDEPASKRGRRAESDPEEEEDARPRRGRRAVEEDDAEPDEKPARRGRSAEREEDSEDKEEQVSRRGRRGADKDDVAEPDDSEEAEPEEKPARRRRVAEEDEEDAPSTRRARRSSKDEDDDDEADDDPVATAKRGIQRLKKRV